MEITLQNSAEFALQPLLPGLEFMMDLHCVLYFHLPCQNFSYPSLRDEFSSLKNTLIYLLYLFDFFNHNGINTFLVIFCGGDCLILLEVLGWLEIPPPISSLHEFLLEFTWLLLTPENILKQHQYNSNKWFLITKTTYQSILVSLSKLVLVGGRAEKGFCLSWFLDQCFDFASSLQTWTIFVLSLSLQKTLD